MNVEDSYQDVTVVPPTAVALIVREDGEMELAIPKDEDVDWHPTQMALAQLAIKFLNDPEWVQQLTDDLKASAS